MLSRLVSHSAAPRVASRFAPLVAATSARQLHAGRPSSAAKVSPAELTKILSERIANFSDQQDVQEVGR
eukprot:CAMPEP_0206557934 /NCGR_PEP_ID=MMETSP0325_2-20121206/19438_1 /ASSEMBLY_ACC=CAM_ASM_000347 /TAXON_ID=2866 /ORGANISM="Crypthecodinium cohnii, Strain Seligo" /LENGTH=68 /DNA_ID=CAMNT_0054059027 /DNA_START=74 /DNA_END=277 /DNA_ORIENTATION=-